MIERNPTLDWITHLVLILGSLLAILPLWFVFVAATLSIQEINSPHLNILPGEHFFENINAAWGKTNLGLKLLNSLFVSIAVAFGKIMLASLTAFALVFFRFPGRQIIFWMIFITLMLPLEVRIVPTYAVASNVFQPLKSILDILGLSYVLNLFNVKFELSWNLLNSYTGLILPLIATATGTFLFRQFYMSIPDELIDAAKMDGAGPIRFYLEILWPLSQTTIAALFTIMFLYTWNQYLWPLLIITDRQHFGTAVMALREIIPLSGDSTGGGTPDWNVAMAAALIVMSPPIFMVVFMQKFFIKGLVSIDK
jgi:sn-glycerol 3-phosphate transport system permease protein